MSNQAVEADPASEKDKKGQPADGGGGGETTLTVIIAFFAHSMRRNRRYS